MANRLLNVLQLISSLEVGGSEKLLIDFLAACRDDDQVNFTVVVMNQAINPEMRERLERLGLNVYFMNRPEGHQHPRYLWQLLKIIHRHQVQIIHAHNYGSKMWGSLCKILVPGLKLVFTIHDTMTLPRLNWKHIRVHRHIIDRNIAISAQVASLCNQRGILNHTQIYNGIPLTNFINTQKSGLCSRLSMQGVDVKPLQIVHVGRMDYPVKGQDILIDAISLCVKNGLKVQCSLMGGVYAYSRDSFKALQDQVHQLGLSETVNFLVNRTDVPAVLATGDIFVLPSRYEGLGLAVLEAMAAGLPVIASNTDGPKELVEDGVNGLLFENGNAEHLFHKIRFLYDNPAEADRMREVAFQRVKRFDIHAMKRQYYQLYQSILPAPGNRSLRQPQQITQALAGRLTDEASV